MKANTGVYETTKKDGTKSFRVSITYRNKHISLGSYSSYEIAHQVYLEGRLIVEIENISPEDYDVKYHLPFEKFISLVNFKNNGLYFSTPIYLRKQYFEYYLSSDMILKFDRDDLFFYASHKIQQRGGYLFVSDYGSQYKILSRYGIKPFAVYGRDYIMNNGDKYDYRYTNIKILSNYMGVIPENGKFVVKIHVNGNYQVGTYISEQEAAVAYNKAVDILHANGFTKAYIKNYIVTLKKAEYQTIYEQIEVSKKLFMLKPENTDN